MALAGWQEAFWTKADRDLREVTEDWANQALEALAADAAGADGHERGPDRQAWRNGYRRRGLLTCHGLPAR